VVAKTLPRRRQTHLTGLHVSVDHIPPLPGLTIEHGMQYAWTVNVFSRTRRLGGYRLEYPFFVRDWWSK